MNQDTRKRSGTSATTTTSSSSSTNTMLGRNSNHKSHPNPQQQPRSYTLGFLICSNLLVLQLTSMYWWTHGFGNDSNLFIDERSLGASVVGSSSLLSVQKTGSTGPMHLAHPMSIPEGKAVALPSVRVSSTEKDAASENPGYYGGKGDKPHLGGFANDGIDFSGVSPAAWTLMVERHGVHSLLDVGCGRGISTSWFVDHGVDAQCVEGSHDAVTQNFLMKDHPELVTEHDFTRGPWWPTDTVDAVWSVEVLEHVSRNFHQNLIPAFRKAALIYCSHSVWGGHHHVEVHDTKWWIAKFESFGFVYNEELTNQIKSKASEHKWDPTPNAIANDGQLTSEQNHNSERYNAQHLWTHMMVFINPAVASLPKHNHILSEHGCYNPYTKDKPGLMGHRKCGDASELPPGQPSKVADTEMALPDDYLALELTKEQDNKWEQRIFGKTSSEAEAEWKSKQQHQQQPPQKEA